MLKFFVVMNMNETTDSEVQSKISISWETLLSLLMIKSNDTLGYEENPHYGESHKSFSTTNPPMYEFKGNEKTLIQIVHILSKELEKNNLKVHKFDLLLNEVDSMKGSLIDLKKKIEQLESFKTQKLVIPDSWLVNDS